MDWTTLIGAIAGALATVLGSGGVGAWLQSRSQRLVTIEDRAWGEVKELRGVVSEMSKNLDLAQDKIADLKLENALLKRDIEAAQKDASKAIEREQAAIEREQLLMHEVESLRSELAQLKEQLGGPS